MSLLPVNKGKNISPRMGTTTEEMTTPSILLDCTEAYTKSHENTLIALLACLMTYGVCLRTLFTILSMPIGPVNVVKRFLCISQTTFRMIHDRAALKVQYPGSPFVFGQTLYTDSLRIFERRV